MTIFTFERSVKQAALAAPIKCQNIPIVIALLIFLSSSFSSRHISDEMSVKIVLSINLSPVAAVVDLLAITALSG